MKPLRQGSNAVGEYYLVFVTLLLHVCVGDNCEDAGLSLNILWTRLRRLI